VKKVIESLLLATSAVPGLIIRNVNIITENFLIKQAKLMYNFGNNLPAEL
jgi:hypothetical protein